MFRVNSVSTFWRGVAVAVMSVLLASAARVVLLGHLGDRGIYITYFPAIAITGLIGGFWPAVLAAGMSVFATRLMSGNFVPPDPQRIETVRAVTAITFLASSLIIAAASGIMHRSRRREKAADEARRASVEALAESEARFSTMANASSVIIWLADADGKLTWVNNRWRELVGSDENEVGDAWAKYLHPDDADRITRAYQEAMAARRPFRLDYRVRRHDGEYRWLLDSGTPRLDADGRLIGYIGSAVDITDMKRATQRLRESEARLRLGLAAGEVGTWDWDFEKHRITWSDRLYEFHGLREGEFDGSVESYKNLIHPDDRGRVESAVRKALHEPDGAYRLEFRALRPDGSVRWLATTGSVMRDDAGRPLRMLGATIDVTERRKLEETQRRLLASERAARSDAERASNLKDEFLATLSHELRTPLSAILGWSQLLQSGRLSEKDHDEGLAVIERNARMQKQLIEDLLDVSRIITGKFRLEVQSVQLIDVASAALDTLRPSIEAKEIQLVTSFDSSLPLVRGDPARLQQVVWNLLTNAVKFTPRGGRVELAVRREGSQIELSVTDTGLGIEPEFLSQLFQRFRQADASTTRRHGGLGLGLAICKHIIELHGGNVAAESEGHGKGARFIVRLPIPALETAGGAADAAPGGETGPTESLRNVRVLMLDDDLDSQRLVTRILEATQASVTPVSSATEALELLERETFDIVISDIGMPNIDGYMFIQRVRSAANGKHRLPAVALTAFARPEDRRHALEAGFDRFLSKPIEAAELQATVKELLEQTVSH